MMFRKITQQFRRTLLLAMAAAMAVALASAPARAARFSYTAHTRTVNAGILVQSFPDNTVPAFPFYILDQRTDIKPAAWTFANPLAPTTVSSTMINSWDYLATVGAQVTPSMAPYWEISLPAASESDLAKFDVLLIYVNADIHFQQGDVEKLRRYVDGGGVLWVDYQGGGGLTTSPLFFGVTPGASVSSDLQQNMIPPAPTPPPVPPDPLISSPFWFTPADGARATGAAGANVMSDPLYDLEQADDQGVILSRKLGAGYIVVTGNDLADAVNATSINGQGYNYVQDGTHAKGVGVCLFTSATDTPPLKLLTNIISLTEAHGGEFKDSHQNNSTGDSPGAAVIPTWNYPFPPPNVPIPQATSTSSLPAPVFDGNMVFVRDVTGNLRAFDIRPEENLLQTGGGADEVVTTGGGVVPDWSQGAPFDEIWSVQLSAFDSAPTLVIGKNGAHQLAVEREDGSIVLFNAGDGSSSALPPASALPQMDYANYGINAPAPVVYEHYLFAGGFDITSGNSDAVLFVYDLDNPGSSAAIHVSPTNIAGNSPEYVEQSPTVGIMPNGGGLDNLVVALVPTNKAVYTVIIGGRGEQLTDVSGGAGTSWATALQSIINPNVTIGPFYKLYNTSDGTRKGTWNRTPNVTPSPAPTNSKVFSTAMGTPQVFADYNIDLSYIDGKTHSDNSISRTTILGTSSYLSNPMNGKYGQQTYFSPVVMDSSGNYYFTVWDEGDTYQNSALFCVNDASGVKTIRWRFRLPNASVTETNSDADGGSYGILSGFHFTGAPVIDQSGYLYVAATDGTSQTAILAFDTKTASHADMFPDGAPGSITGVSIWQGLGSSATTIGSLGTEFAANDPGELGSGPNGNLQLPPAMYTFNDLGRIDFLNFGNVSANPSIPGAVTPMLDEAHPFYTQYVLNNNNTIGPYQVFFHSHLVWFTILPAPTLGGPQYPKYPISNITLLGSYLWFTDGYGLLWRLYTSPQTGMTLGLNGAPQPLVGKEATMSTSVFSDAEKKPVLEVYAAGSAGAVSLPASAPAYANGVVVTSNGYGIFGYGGQQTVVADNNRLIGMDADGDALWTIDSTTSVNGASSLSVPFNHPTSVSQTAAGDFLLADTGNNRCLRVDRSGNLFWELSSFTDPANLLDPSEPRTLNRPTSVRAWSETKVVGTDTHALIHYLIADTGNHRIISVKDDYDLTLNSSTALGQLEWCTTTQRDPARDYEYTNANIYFSPNGAIYVVAIIANKQIGAAVSTAAAAGSLAPASDDRPGSCIVRLAYKLAGATAISAGYVTSTAPGVLDVINQFKIWTQPSASNKYDYSVPPSTPGQWLTPKNARYLSVYTPNSTNGSVNPNLMGFLLADDNGVFDVTADFSPPPPVQPTPFHATWGYMAGDFQSLTAPIDSVNATFVRSKYDFRPTSIQLTGHDLVNGYTVGRYLITNDVSDGEVASSATAYGGEAFELQAVQSSGSYTMQGINANGRTFSRPSNTSPISQPTCAIRTH